MEARLTVPSTMAGTCIAGRKDPVQDEASEQTEHDRAVTHQDEETGIGKSAPAYMLVSRSAPITPVTGRKWMRPATIIRPLHDSPHGLPLREEPDDGGVRQIGPFVVRQVPRRNLDIPG